MERKKGNSLIMSITDYTVIDLETTSKYPNQAEIIELSAVRVRSDEIVETFTKLVKPLKPVTETVTKLTGITNEMLSDAPEIKNILKEYIDFIGDDIILGHNIVSYDSTILYDLCESLGLKRFSNTMLDTLRYVHYCDIDVPNYKLKTLSEYFEIEHQAHRALNDCIANFQIYKKLKTHFTGQYILRESTSVQRVKITGVKPEYSDLQGKSIVLTGEFACGERKEIKMQLEQLGASVKKGVSSKTDYLLIGSIGSPDWKFGDYGDKANKAQKLQLQGKNLQIVQEGEFFECKPV